ncbi:alpha/beta fold hydrolase [Promicromonospora thailandica]|uniref:Pimeloyl-ACP methyl ester carboxylesterase n=1 Tax=Promicromonospora thailandica TaxID=765201 RepID=A0A9X2G4Y2_9MICO|nr:alpha/beta hydrolase [Promicromonospora thailandica]MCP2265778.1 Pimeloyl-ACP methyl ester carboxylesterase [Promicromonospora thailandica]BFF21801.1 alpha/beta hydrolase [Promicromonospora thailandica]
MGVHKPRHLSVEVDGVEIFYREAGAADVPGTASRPGILLLHGYPSSSHMFRDVLAPLAEVGRVVAPDLPGFGFSAAPSVDEYEYTFSHLADTVEAFLERIGLDRFFVYLHDFGAPVGYHLATRHPERILGLVVQNGNAHDAGLGSQWDSARAFWADPSDANRARLPEWLTFEGTRDEYVSGLPDRVRVLHPPESWHLDWERMSRPGNLDAQFELFRDYANHVARFAELAEYHRVHQPPCLVLWGRHDAYFDLAEIMAYAGVLDRLEMHVYDAGHMVLETHSRECGAAMRDFVRDVAAGAWDRPASLARPL